MSRGFNGQWRYSTSLVQANTFIDNILVAPHIAMMLQMQLVLQKVCQLIRGYRICNNGAAWIVWSQNSRHHGNQGITANLLTIRQYSTHAIHISIKNNTQICMTGENCSLNGIHSSLILWIWNMIWEMSIWLQIETALNIGPQRNQYLVGKEATSTIAGIYYNMHSFERLVIILGLNPLTNLFTEILGININ